VDVVSVTSCSAASPSSVICGTKAAVVVVVVVEVEVVNLFLLFCLLKLDLFNERTTFVIIICTFKTVCLKYIFTFRQSLVSALLTLLLRSRQSATCLIWVCWSAFFVARTKVLKNSIILTRLDVNNLNTLNSDFRGQKCIRLHWA